MPVTRIHWLPPTAKRPPKKSVKAAVVEKRASVKTKSSPRVVAHSKAVPRATKPPVRRASPSRGSQPAAITAAPAEVNLTGAQRPFASAPPETFDEASAPITDPAPASSDLGGSPLNADPTDNSASVAAFASRIDATATQLFTIQGQDDNNEELIGLVERAVTLLESISAQPALRDFNDLKQRLSTVEQQLNQSGNVR